MKPVTADGDADEQDGQGDGGVEQAQFGGSQQDHRGAGQDHPQEYEAGAGPAPLGTGDGGGQEQEQGIAECAVEAFRKAPGMEGHVVQNAEGEGLVKGRVAEGGLRVEGLGAEKVIEVGKYGVAGVPQGFEIGEAGDGESKQGAGHPRAGQGHAGEGDEKGEQESETADVAGAGGAGEGGRAPGVDAVLLSFVKPEQQHGPQQENGHPILDAEAGGDHRSQRHRGQTAGEATGDPGGHAPMEALVEHPTQGRQEREV